MSAFQLKEKRGFTLIELLTVIAVIGILAAILIPTVNRIRESARITQGRAQFGQWITAIENFRAEYGYWPDFNSQGPQWEATRLNNEDNLVARINESRDHRRNFIEFLYGRYADGEAWIQNGTVLPRYQNHPNRRRINFYDFTENDYEFLPNRNTLDRNADNFVIVDSFGHSDIVIIMDGNDNGMIRFTTNAGEYGVRPNPGRSPSDLANQAITPYANQRDVRARVIIYSAGPGGRNADEVRDKMIRTW